MSFTNLINPAKLFQLTALSTALVIAGCGGGGGSPADTTDYFPPKNSGDNNGGSTDGDGGNDTIVENLNVSDLVLTNSSNASSRIFDGSGGTASVTVTDENGNPVQNAKVDFNGDAITFDGNGSKLTDANGTASISFKPSEGSISGAYTMSATASSGSKTATTNTFNFALNVSNSGSDTIRPVNVQDISLASGTKLTDSGSTAEVLVLDSSGNPIKNAVVTFTGEGVVLDGNGKVFTDVNGFAVIGIKPADNVVNGIYQLTATAEYQGNTDTSSVFNFEIESTGEVVGDPVNITDITLETDSSGALPTTGGKATVTVTDENGNPVSGAAVIFTVSDIEKVSLSSSNGTVMTNVNGEASITLSPTLSADTGTYSVTASTTYKGKTDTSEATYFSLSALGLQLVDLTANASEIEAGGSSLITLTTKDSNGNAQNGVVVDFSATCGTFTANSVESASQGNVSTTYNAVDIQGNLCEGTQTITARNSNGVSETVNVEVAQIVADSVQYNSGDVTLGVKGSGSSNTGNIGFTVYSNGVPVGNQPVRITQVYAPEDMSFVTLNNKVPQVVESDSRGVVSVNLYPGYKSGPVEIKAELLDENGNVKATALSKNVRVDTGRATQEGFSISVSKNVLDDSVDGDEADVTARLVDRLGNAVPDGTVVSFYTEGGKIDPNCSTVNGVCTVKMTTQNPRTDYRHAVVAFVEGNKTYVDSNGNNAFDLGEAFTNNIGDIFRDDNENSFYDSSLGERLYARNAGNESCGTSTFSQPTLADTCNSELEAVLRFQFIMAFGSSNPYITTSPVAPFAGLTGEISANANSYSFYVFGNGAGTVPMPSGTKFSISVDDNTNYKPVAVLVSGSSGNIVNVSNAPANYAISVTLDGVTYTGITDALGVASISVGNATGTPTVADLNEKCEADLYGDEEVVDVFDLKDGTGTINPKDVEYTIRYKGCQADDVIEFTVDAPSAKTKYGFVVQ